MKDDAPDGAAPSTATAASMKTRYRARAGLTWVEAREGGRADRVVWISDVATATQFQLEGSAWLVWVLITDGATDVDELRAAAAELGAEQAFDEFDVAAFLESLVDAGLLDRVEDGPGRHP